MSFKPCFEAWVCVEMVVHRPTRGSPLKSLRGGGVSPVVFSATGFSAVLGHSAGADSPKYHNLFVLDSSNSNNDAFTAP